MEGGIYERGGIFKSKYGIGLGLAVHVSVTLRIQSRFVRNRILKFNMWECACRTCHFTVMPVRFLHRKPMEPCEQNIWRIVLTRIIIFGS